MATETTSSGFASGASTLSDKLSSAGDAVENGANEAGTRARRAARATASALSTGADYIRENNARDMVGDVMDLAKKNPAIVLVGAIALGVLVARAFTSRD